MEQEGCDFGGFDIAAVDFVPGRVECSSTDIPLNSVGKGSMRTRRGRITIDSGAAESVDRYTSHETFSTYLTLCTHHIVAQGVFGAHSLHLHVIHDVTCLSVCCFFCIVFFLSLSRFYFLSHCLPVLCPVHQLPCRRNRRGLKPLHSRTTRSIAPWRYTTLSQGYEPNLLDNFDYSETSAAIFQDESGDTDTEPSYSFDAELDDELIRKALSS